MSFCSNGVALSNMVGLRMKVEALPGDVTRVRDQGASAGAQLGPLMTACPVCSSNQQLNVRRARCFWV